MTAAKRRATPLEQEPSDAELLAQIASADLSALGALFDRHHARVERVLQRTGLNLADVDDVVQATFLEVPRIATTFDGRESCAPWLCGIAIRLGARRRRSLRRLFDHLTAWAKEAPSRDPVHPESVVASRQELAAFERALETLAPKKREAFVLVELEGFSAEEAGKALGVNGATMRTRLFHARGELRAAMARELR
jgi:RNA polymerase sigma-70 factor (ECF subfamily)